MPSCPPHGSGSTWSEKAWEWNTPTMRSQHLLAANAARRWRAAQVAESSHPPSGDGGYRKRAIRFLPALLFLVANTSW